MNKLKLNLDRLQVQSFETERPGTGAGTVRGHVWTIGTCQNTEIGRGCGRTLETGCMTCPVPCTVDETCDAQCGV